MPRVECFEKNLDQYEDWFKFARFNEGEKAFLPVNYLSPIGAHLI